MYSTVPVEFNCSHGACVSVVMFVLRADVLKLNVPTKSRGKAAYNMGN